MGIILYHCKDPFWPTSMMECHRGGWTLRSGCWDSPKPQVTTRTMRGWWNTFDAPVDMVNIPLFTGFYTSQVVQDFFHQQYYQCKSTQITQTITQKVTIEFAFVESSRSLNHLSRHDPQKGDRHTWILLDMHIPARIDGTKKVCLHSSLL